MTIDYTWLILTRQLSRRACNRDWGGVQAEWNAVESRLIEGDEVWEYECSVNHQHPLSGTTGVAIRREGRIIDHVVTGRTFT